MGFASLLKPPPPQPAQPLSYLFLAPIGRAATDPLARLFAEQLDRRRTRWYIRYLDVLAFATALGIHKAAVAMKMPVAGLNYWVEVFTFSIFCAIAWWAGMKSVEPIVWTLSSDEGADDLRMLPHTPGKILRAMLQGTSGESTWLACSLTISHVAGGVFGAWEGTNFYRHSMHSYYVHGLVHMVATVIIFLGCVRLGAIFSLTRAAQRREHSNGPLTAGSVWGALLPLFAMTLAAIFAAAGETAVAVTSAVSSEHAFEIIGDDYLGYLPWVPSFMAMMIVLALTVWWLVRGFEKSMAPPAWYRPY